MSVHLVGSAIVRTTPGVGSWTVWAVEQSGGVASAHRRHGLTEVVVADAPSSATEAPANSAIPSPNETSARKPSRSAAQAGDATMWRTSPRR